MELKSEELLYNLTLAGRAAGSQRLTTQFERGLFVMRLEAHFQGGLGSHKRSQVSRLEPQSRLPVAFVENDNGRVFETTFDRRDGLVRVRQQRDEAVAALTQDYHDPVSLLQLLRDLADDVRSLRVPMVGGNVLITRLEDETVSSPWGPRAARVYYLRPGVSLVYVDLEVPHRILKLTQSLGRLALEAQLSRVSEGVAPTAAEPVRARDGAREGSLKSRRAQRQERLKGQERAQPIVRNAPPPKPVQAPPAAESAGESRSKRRRRNRNANRAARADGGEAPIPQTAVHTPRSSSLAVPTAQSGESGVPNPNRKRRRRRRGRGANGGGSEP